MEMVIHLVMPAVLYSFSPVFSALVRFIFKMFS